MKTDDTPRYSFDLDDDGDGDAPDHHANVQLLVKDVFEPFGPDTIEELLAVQWFYQDPLGLSAIRAFESPALFERWLDADPGSMGTAQQTCCPIGYAILIASLEHRNDEYGRHDYGRLDTSPAPAPEDAQRRLVDLDLLAWGDESERWFRLAEQFIDLADVGRVTEDDLRMGLSFLQ